MYRTLGLNDGEAHVIRNAGGVVTDDDALDERVVRQVLGKPDVGLVQMKDVLDMTWNIAQGHTVVGGFSISQLFYYVSPTPGGVGFVEGLFPIILRALNVSYPKATLVTLVYRFRPDDYQRWVTRGWIP